VPRSLNSRIWCELFLLLVIGLNTSCSGGGQTTLPPPPPLPDFDLSVAPGTLPVTVGTSSPPLVVSVARKNGFTGTVSISIGGLPQGAASVPASPFMVTAGTTQQVTISIPLAAQTGLVSLLFSATSSQIARSTSLNLNITPTPTVRTFQNGPILYLETVTGNETARLGLLTTWGGAIVEASLNGSNPVNSDDPGREVQVSLWDGDASYSPLWGWNLIQAGDHFFQGSPVLTQVVGPDSIYIKTQPIQWAPENFGGGPGHPVLGDAYIEEWLTPVPGHGRAFQVHYKITHFGNDTHANFKNEFPAVYVNPGFDTFMYYGGSSAWTYGPLSPFTMPQLPNFSPYLNTVEYWGAYADSNNSGLTVYTPGAFPYVSGFDAGVTKDFSPVATFTWQPGTVVESDIYVIAGPVTDARTVIYDLHARGTYPGAVAPFGMVQTLKTGDTLAGTATPVSGFAFGRSPVASVQVFVDGSLVGTANYGTPRPDITAVFPGESEDSGFEFSFDTTTYKNGPHLIVVKATDSSGKLAIFPTIHVNISNP
jgi:hypothetical protein